MLLLGEPSVLMVVEGSCILLRWVFHRVIISSHTSLSGPFGVGSVEVYLRLICEEILPMNLQLGEPHLCQLRVLCEHLEVRQVLIISEAVFIGAVLPTLPITAISLDDLSLRSVFGLTSLSYGALHPGCWPRRKMHLLRDGGNILRVFRLFFLFSYRTLVIIIII